MAFLRVWQCVPLKGSLREYMRGVVLRTTHFPEEGQCNLDKMFCTNLISFLSFFVFHDNSYYSISWLVWSILITTVQLIVGILLGWLIPRWCEVWSFFFILDCWAQNEQAITSVTRVVSSTVPSAAVSAMVAFFQKETDSGQSSSGKAPIVDSTLLEDSVFLAFI